jgi:hypothetical protein
MNECRNESGGLVLLSVLSTVLLLLDWIPTPSRSLTYCRRTILEFIYLFMYFVPDFLFIVVVWHSPSGFPNSQPRREVPFESYARLPATTNRDLLHPDAPILLGPNRKRHSCVHCLRHRPSRPYAKSETIDASRNVDTWMLNAATSRDHSRAVLRSIERESVATTRVVSTSVRVQTYSYYPPRLRLLARAQRVGTADTAPIRAEPKRAGFSRSSALEEE